MPQKLAFEAARLGSVAAFADLPPAVLDWLGQAGELTHYASGEVLARAGDAAEHLLAVVAGGIHYLRPDTGEPVFRMEAGQTGGVLPYSRLRVVRADSVAVGDTVLYTLPRTQFPALEQVSPELVQRLVSLMNDRARAETRGQERDDKLRALGKLTAGLAHELNNPAAAISRAAASLGTALQAKPAQLQTLLTAGPDPAAVVALVALAAAPAVAPPPLSALQAANREDALADWLETQGCPDGYALAASLLDAGLDQQKLAGVAAGLAAAARPPAFAWLAGHLGSLRLAADIREASQRVSGLVADMKTYTHMDRGQARERLLVTTGLDSTLNIFAHALRDKHVALSRAYAPGLPLVLGQVGGLNQVWTNLIDNALDVLPDPGGELLVSAEKQSSGVCVSIQDNGPGIAPEVLPHIFDPFYTTKPPGEGTGQGLEIARRIVLEHQGRLEVASAPGRTVFSVWLPVG